MVVPLSVTFTLTHPPAHSPSTTHLPSPPYRRFTWTEVQRRIEPAPAPPRIGNASLGHGAYFWDQDTTTLTLKLRGGQEAVEIRTEAAIQVGRGGREGRQASGQECYAAWYAVAGIFLRCCMVDCDEQGTLLS
jgi:hypothetical protein